jgi:hypothetical protein
MRDHLGSPFDATLIVKNEISVFWPRNRIHTAMGR